MSALRRWTVRSDPTGSGWNAWFYVFIYETTDQLRAAARKYTYNGQGYFDDAAACFHPNLSYRVNKKTGKLERCAKTAFIGVMRLSMELLEPHVVIHECAHAAIHYVMALKLNSEYVVGRNIETEEAIAYAVHEFSDALLRKLGML